MALLAALQQDKTNLARGDALALPIVEVVLRVHGAHGARSAEYKSVLRGSSPADVKCARAMPKPDPSPAAFRPRART